MQGVSTGLRELLDKKKLWYEEQLAREREVLHQIEVRLRNEMGPWRSYIQKNFRYGQK